MLKIRRWINKIWYMRIKNYSSEVINLICVYLYLSIYTHIYLQALNSEKKKKYIAILPEHVVCNYSEGFTCIKSFNPQNHPLKQMLLLLWGTEAEKSSDFSKDTALSPESMLLTALLNWPKETAEQRAQPSPCQYQNHFLKAWHIERNILNSQ